MKIIKKQVYVQVPKTLESYMSSDGFEFASRTECENHERVLGFRGIKVIETAIKDLNDFYEERPMVMYNVENEDDWNTLVERVWFYRQSEKQYPGPGKYLAVQEYCGDHPEERHKHHKCQEDQQRIDYDISYYAIVLFALHFNILLVSR